MGHRGEVTPLMLAKAKARREAILTVLAINCRSWLSAAAIHEKVHAGYTLAEIRTGLSNLYQRGQIQRVQVLGDGSGGRGGKGGNRALWAASTAPPYDGSNRAGTRRNATRDDPPNHP
jgi:hypothetical protein